MKALFCLSYLVSMGIIVFLCGRFFPRKWILENHFPYKSFVFEKQGKIYEKIHIRKWKTKWPDASKLFNKILGEFYPKKQIESNDTAKISVLIKESCIAESTHFIAILLGFFCLKIWFSVYGFIISVLWMLWNIPPIIIQRYNRPRLKKVMLTIKN